MTNKSRPSDAAVAEARARALEEAAAKACHMAEEWRVETEGNHSSHHLDLRRSWADAADRVAKAIAALAKQDRQA